MTDFTLPEMPAFVFSDFLHASWLVLAQFWTGATILSILAVIAAMILARRTPLQRDLEQMQYDAMVRRANQQVMREAWLRRKALFDEKRKDA